MAGARTPWWTRWKKPTAPAQRTTNAREDYTGGANLNSTDTATQFLLSALRTNPPGYTNENYFELSQSVFGAVYLAINTKALQASIAQIRLFERDSDDPEAREALSEHEDICALIHEPNPDDSFGDILEQIVMQFDTCGTALVWTPTDPEDPYDVPTEQYVLSTASCLPQPCSPQYPNGAYMVQPWYPAGPFATIPTYQGIGAMIPAEQVMRIKSAHPLFRWTGYSALYAIASQIDSLRMIDASRTSQFEQGFDPSAIISFDPAVQRVDEAQARRLTAQLQQVWAGPRNVGRLAVLPSGADVNILSTSPKDMAYQEGYAQMMDFVLATLGANKAVAGMTGDLSYATLYASLRAFFLLRLNPFLAKVAQCYQRQLIWPRFGRWCGFELEAASITDEELQLKQLGLLASNSAIKIGELRKQFPQLKLKATDRDDEWVGQQQGDAGGQMSPNQQGEGGDLAQILGGIGNDGLPDGEGSPGGSEREPGDPDQRQAQRGQRTNHEGRGSLGPRGSFKTLSAYESERTDRLAAAFERKLSMGHIKPLPNGNGKTH